MSPKWNSPGGGIGCDEPDEIDAKMDAELDEEIEHLADVGGVPVRVEQRGGRPGVTQVHRHDLVAPPRWEAEDVHVVAPRRRDPRDGEPPALFVGDHSVGWRVRGKEGKLGGDRGRDSAHLRRRRLRGLINGPEGDTAFAAAGDGIKKPGEEAEEEEQVGGGFITQLTTAGAHKMVSHVQVGWGLPSL